MTIKVQKHVSITIDGEDVKTLSDLLLIAHNAMKRELEGPGRCLCEDERFFAGVEFRANDKHFQLIGQIWDRI